MTKSLKKPYINSTSQKNLYRSTDMSSPNLYKNDRDPQETMYGLFIVILFILFMAGILAGIKNF